MKDNLLEKLMELFNDSLSKRTAAAKDTDLDNGNAKENAVDWGEISHIENNTYFIKESGKKSNRISCLQEKVKLTARSRKFLAQLNHLNIIGEKTFELILNQLVFSSSEFVTLHETKWVIFKTLENNLTENQLALLNLILYQNEDEVTQH